MSKIVKFGGKSLANGKGINEVVNILEQKLKKKEKLVVTLSARGKATDELELILEKAALGLDYTKAFESFKAYQIEPLPNIDFKKEFELLEGVFKGISLVKDYSLKTKDLVLAQGEILATKIVSELLNDRGAKTIAVDSRDLLKTDKSYGNGRIVDLESKLNVVSAFKSFKHLKK